MDEARFQELFGASGLTLTLALTVTQGLSSAPAGFGLPDGHFGIPRLEIQNGNHFGKTVTYGLHFGVQSTSLGTWRYQTRSQELETDNLLSSFLLLLLLLLIYTLSSRFPYFVL